MMKLPDLNALGARPMPSGEYRGPRVDVSPTLAGYSSATFGKAVGQLGDVLEKKAEEETKQKVSRQSAYAGLNFTKRIMDFEKAKKDDPYYDKHEAEYEEFVSKNIEELAQTIEDDNERESFRLRASSIALDGLGRIRSSDREKQKDAEILQTQIASDSAKEIFLNAPDDKMREDAIQNFSKAINSNQFLSETDKWAAQRKWLAETREAWVENLPAVERVKLLEGVAESRKTVLNPNVPKDFETAAKLVLDFEKPKYVENDGGYGPSKYGIVGSQNGLTPEQVRNLTPKKAIEIAKKNYWDANNIDSMPESFRFIAFDTVYNFARGSQLVKEANGDPQKLAELRRKEHERIATEKADTHGQYREGWKNRDAYVESKVFKDVISVKDKDTFGIPTDRLNVLLEKAKSEVESEGVKSRASLRLREEDAISMAMSGKENPNPITFAEFQRAYPEDAEKRYNEHNNAIAFAVDYNRALTMPISQQTEMLSKYEPKAGEGFDVAKKKQESMARAIAEANKSRNSDPIAFAMQSGLMPKEQIDFASPEKTAKQLDARVSIAKEMSVKYGTPVEVFTKQEASNLSGLMEGKDAISKLSLLRKLKDGIKDVSAYNSAIQQIRKDSPSTALAGQYMAMGDKVMEVSTPIWGANIKQNAGEVALNILRGEELINPSKKTKEESGTSAKVFPLPPEKDLREIFNNETKNLFAGMPEMQDQLFQAAKAYYAAAASDKGIYSGVRDVRIMEQATKAILGEKTDINGSDILVPWGMDVYEFEKNAKTNFETKRNEAGISDKAIKWDDVELRMTPVFGVFRVYNGNKAIADKNGEPLLIDTLIIPPKDNTPTVKKIKKPTLHIGINPLAGVL